MSDIFGQLVGTLIETAKLPIDVAKDICTGCGKMTGEESATVERLEKIKEEAHKQNNE